MSTITAALLFAFANVSLALAGPEDLGRKAEEVGKPRKALKHYTAALKEDPGSFSLRKKIITLVHELEPPPAIPETAERHLARGRAATKSAKDKRGYERAAKEFDKALLAAPWLADGYYNLGLVHDKAGRYEAAIRSFRLYLLAAPEAPDRKEVKSLIYEIEYRQEEAGRVKKETAKQRKKTSITNLAGLWSSRVIRGDYYKRPGFHTKWQKSGGTKLYVSISGDEFTARYKSRGKTTATYRGTIIGTRIIGDYRKARAVNLCPGEPPRLPMEGEIRAEENKILLVVEGAPGAGCRVDQRSYWMSILLHR